MASEAYEAALEANVAELKYGLDHGYSMSGDNHYGVVFPNDWNRMGDEKTSYWLPPGSEPLPEFIQAYLDDIYARIGVVPTGEVEVMRALPVFDFLRSDFHLYPKSGLGVGITVVKKILEQPGVCSISEYLEDCSLAGMQTGLYSSFSVDAEYELGRDTFEDHPEARAGFALVMQNYSTN